MAEADNTLAGLVQMNDRNLADIGVTDLLQDTPVLAVLYAVPASEGGTLHKYTKETVAAGGEFREVNTGVLNAAGQEELVTVTCKYFDGHFHRDVAIAKGFKDGAAAYMAKQTVKSIRRMMVGIEAQILQGTTLDADGFSGAPEYSFVDALDEDMVVDAEGAGGASVWLVRSTEEDVAIVAGNDGQLNFQFDPEQAPQKIITDAGTGAGYMAFVADLGGWYAVQFGSRYSIGRIVNLDGTATLDDDMIADAISRFPAGKPPTSIIMNRTQQKELRESRTTYSPTGQPAPFPSEAFGIPIVITDHIKTDEPAMTTTTTTTP